jgi:predicted naringenin-chalcone synthase
MKKYDLDHNGDDWYLRQHGNQKATKVFHEKTKEEALRAMKYLLDGPSSVRIKKMDHAIQEERTYPRSSDPKKSPG